MAALTLSEILGLHVTVLLPGKTNLTASAMRLRHRCPLCGKNGRCADLSAAAKRFVAALNALAKSRQSGRKPLKGKTRRCCPDPDRSAAYRSKRDKRKARASWWREKGTLIPKHVGQGFQQVFHASPDNKLHVPSASMIESIHAGQDKYPHAPSASMIESIHAGQDNNVHVPSACMISRASMLAKIITFMFLVHP